MAGCIRYVCQNCRFDLESWDEGCPYYIDERGKKRYAFHPDPMRDKCIGNDSPYICLECGRQFKVDSRAPRTNCPKCKSTDIIDTFNLQGQKCPKCKKGVIMRDPDFFIIS